MICNNYNQLVINDALNYSRSVYKTMLGRKTLKALPMEIMLSRKERKFLIAKRFFMFTQKKTFEKGKMSHLT